MVKSPLVYINGDLVTADKAMVSVFDRGFLYGDGVFETMRTYNGSIFCFSDHIERVNKSASLINLTLPWDNDWLKKTISSVLEANNFNDDVIIRLTISRGVGQDGLSLPKDTKPTIVIHTRPASRVTSGDFDKGMQAIISSIRRNIINAVNPAAKSLNFLNNILARFEADNQKAAEAIMLNSDGSVVEGSVSNVFIVYKGIIKTPPITDGLLPGVTRRAVIDLASSNSQRIMESSLWPSDLYQADELFLTMTSVGVAPVTVLDGRAVGTGKAGKVTKKIYSWFQNLILNS